MNSMKSNDNTMWMIFAAVLVVFMFGGSIKSEMCTRTLPLS